MVIKIENNGFFHRQDAKFTKGSQNQTFDLMDFQLLLLLAS
jgi:hypothetical protein